MGHPLHQDHSEWDTDHSESKVDSAKSLVSLEPGEEEWSTHRGMKRASTFEFIP